MGIVCANVPLTCAIFFFFFRKWTTKERPRFKRGKRSKEQSGTPSSVKEEVSVHTKPEPILGVHVIACAIYPICTCKG